jgi:carbon dioxide concentrating mechanism protein CcmO
MANLVVSYTRQDFSDTALGLVSVQSFPAIVGIADHMLKSSGVSLVGYEKIGGGYCTAIIRGGISDVRLAVAEGIERAVQFGQEYSSSVLPRPYPDLEKVLPISIRLSRFVEAGEKSLFADQAVGLLETRGFPAVVGAADAMLKAADVTLAAYETIGAGLCTIIIRGKVASALAALEYGMAEADRIGELHSVMLVPRPLDDMEQTLPLASCWVEEVRPLRLPLNLKETQKSLAEVPERQPLRLPVSQAEMMEPMRELEFEELPSTPQQLEE